MAVNFPINPLVSDTYTDGTKTWECYEAINSGNANDLWIKVSSSTAKIVADLPPTSILSDGQEWTDSAFMLDYTWYEDGSSSQWVQQASSAISPVKTNFEEKGGMIWGSGLTYVVGDMVVDFDTDLAYYCNTPHASIDFSTDSSNWTQIGVEEAPDDGKIYGRNNHKWVEVSDTAKLDFYLEAVNPTDTLTFEITGPLGTEDVLIDWGDGVAVTTPVGVISGSPVSGRVIRIASQDTLTSLKFTSNTTISRFRGDSLRAFTDLTDLFLNCTSLTDVVGINVEGVITMTNAFSGCSSLTSFPAIDTTTVTDFSGMFDGCTSLTCLTQINTTNQLNTTNMFNNTPLLVQPDATAQLAILAGSDWTNPGPCP